MEYAVASWSPWTKTDKEVLEKVQKRAVAMVSNYKAKDYENKLEEAGMIALEKRRERGDLIMMYKIMSGKEDVPYSIWFKKMTELADNGVSTRAATGTLNVQPPGISNTDTRKNFFSQRVVEKWNKLPDSVKQAETTNTFKNRLDEYMFPQARRGHPYRYAQVQ